ncbi:hypothetical protein NKH24_07000 [Mesorhizobium sp. M1300]|uniref:hypothetical protein n=1 Tax=Mesorhizobium sp. M1300 TaxID=2957077 RepID=UPI003335A5E9
MPIMFAGPRTKIERANTHIKELQREISVFLARNPYHVGCHPDMESGMDQLCAVVEELIPERIWAPIIGDVVHNARSALDLLANDLVPASRRGEATFPIWKARDINGNAPTIKGVSEVHQNLIANLQPYVTGDFTLRQLHELDIEDKHRLLIPVAAVSVVQNLSVRRLPNTEPIPFGPRELDASILGIQNLGFSWHSTSRNRYRPTEDFEFDFKLVFGNANPFAGVEILPKLHSLVDAASKVIDDFDAQAI